MKGKKLSTKITIVLSNIFFATTVLGMFSFFFVPQNDTRGIVIRVVITFGSAFLLFFTQLMYKHFNSIEKQMKKINRMPYYRESVLKDYELFDIIGILDELELPIEERSVFCGVIMYFVNEGVLKDDTDRYFLIKLPTNEKELKFVKFLMDTDRLGSYIFKRDIKERLQSKQKEILAIISSSLFENGYLEPSELHRDAYEKMKKRNPELLEDNFTKNHLAVHILTDKGKEAFSKVMASYDFFKEFINMEIRSKAELTLWNDYLVMATLYNFADKVEIDLEDIMPKWDTFEMVY